MGVCNSRDTSNKRFSNLEKQYAQFYKPPTSFFKPLDDLNDNETELLEHITKFTTSKTDLEKSNPVLYSLFFNNKTPKTDTFTYSGLQPHEEDRFHYFFNLLQTPYKKIHLTSSHISFPKFAKNTFPSFRNEKSPLESIIITSSNIILDTNEKFYTYIDECRYLDLSFDNISELPDGIGKLTNLKYLCLRRNLLKKLPESFKELKNVEELDLSENKFQALEKEIFASDKMEKLNMNGNELETFKFVGSTENSCLKYLFLAQNRLTSIPSFVTKLPKIQYINLDDNKITEVDSNLHEDIISDKIEISLHKNAKHLDSIVLTKPNVNIPTFNTLRNSGSIRFSKKHSSKTIMNSEGESMKNSINVNDSSLNGTKQLGTPTPPALFDKGIDDIQDPYDKFRILSPQTQLEIDISSKMKKIINDAQSNDELKDFGDKAMYIKQKRFEYIINVIDNYLASGREKEISSIENAELKLLFKKYYNVYLAKKEYENTGVNTINKDKLDSMEEDFINEYITQSDEMESKREQNDDIKNKRKNGDVGNLLFLAEVNEMIAVNKVNVLLQYVGNVDDVIKECIAKLWEMQRVNEEKNKNENKENKEMFDKNSLILLLTDLKICVNEMGEAFRKKKKNGYNVDYSFHKMVPQNKTHDIFFNEDTRRILGRLGLKNIRMIENGKTVYMKIDADICNEENRNGNRKDNRFVQYYFDFNIVNEMHIKQQHVLYFLERFIGLVKTIK